VRSKLKILNNFYLKNVLLSLLLTDITPFSHFKAVKMLRISTYAFFLVGISSWHFGWSKANNSHFPVVLKSITQNKKKIIEKQ